MKKLIILLGVLTVSLTSCLKDKPTVDLSNIAPFAEFVHSGKAYFTSDAITSQDDTITITMYVNVTGQFAPTSDVTVGVGVDNSLISQFNSADITYESAMPANAYSFPTTSATVKAGNGNRLVSFDVTFYRANLDPSKSYMLPIKLTSVSGAGVSLSQNFNAHFFHFIGNDFAGAYIWDYRRWQNGVGPGAGIIPSQVPTTPDISTLNQAGTISPISPTEFEMKTGYNGNGVKYDVTFTRTVVNGEVAYSNWKVIFNAANLAIWADAGITNMVAPAFTIPPPAVKTTTPVFEINYVSGGAAGRYIDDTYHK